MNSLISREGLIELINTKTVAAASFYLPTAKSLSHAIEGQLTLKNLIREAETRLRGFFYPENQIRQLLAPVRSLDADEAFWKHHSDGLVIFSGDDLFRFYSLPLPLHPEVVVSGRFYIKPLLPMISTPSHFYIAALSKNHPRLYRASGYNIVELSLPEMPDGFADAIASHAHQHEMSFHSAGNAANPGTHLFAAHAGTEDSEKRDLDHYMSELAHEIDRALRSETVPLVLAGVEYLSTMYRRHSHYSNLVQSGVVGSPDHSNPTQLRDEAAQLLDELEGKSSSSSTTRHKEKTLEDVLLEFRTLHGTGRASADAEEIIRAAHDGRIQTLIVASDRKTWGYYNPDDRSVLFFEQQEADGDEIHDLAAARTLASQGEVFVAEGNMIPISNSIAAIFRY